MPRFIIIVPLTPKKLLNPIRLKLFNIFFENLKRIDYENWEAILIGEEEKLDGKIRFKKIGAESKEIKLIYAREYLKSITPKPDYVLRLDDDDLINPYIFEIIKNSKFDCYADKHHLFYDLLSGRTSFQPRPWLANTVVHKYECAMEEIGEDGMTLLQCDHSKVWIDYYRERRIIYANLRHPVYMRVLSPVSITSLLFQSEIQNGLNELNLDLTNDELMKFKKYLKGFGVWKNRNIANFEFGFKELMPLIMYRQPDDKVGFIQRLLFLIKKVSMLLLSLKRKWTKPVWKSS